MSGYVSHFAVYGAEPEVLIAFYGTVFGWTFEPWGPPGYWNIQTPGAKGLTLGALTRRDVDPESGSPNAFRCTIAVHDLAETTRAITTAGGTKASAAVDIPQVGKVAEFRDPAGNLFCAMQYAPGSPLA